MNINITVTYQGKYEKKDTNSLVIVLVIIWHPIIMLIVSRLVIYDHDDDHDDDNDNYLRNGYAWKR